MRVKTGTFNDGKTHGPKHPQGGDLKKGDTMTDEDENIQKSEPVVEPDTVEILKANLEIDINKIVKAQTDEISKSITETLLKAFDEKLKPLEEKVKKIEEQPITKAAIIIPEQVETSASNYGAVEKFMKRG
jgi:hypothetical protein